MTTIVSSAQSYELRNVLLSDRELWVVTYDLESLMCAGLSEEYLDEELGCEGPSEVGPIFFPKTSMGAEALDWFQNLGCQFFGVSVYKQEPHTDILFGPRLSLWPENKEALAKWITAEHDVTKFRLELQREVMNTPPRC